MSLNGETHQSGNKTPTQRNQKRTVFQSFVSGSASSGFTAIIYQPLELVKTRLQIRNVQGTDKILGRAIRSINDIIKTEGARYLWRGTYPSLVRSIPGVGLYYSTLNLLHANYSSSVDRPDNAQQALYFGIISRSIASFTLLPVTVVKVRYESGQYNYPSLYKALTEAYLRNGWVGIAPTIFRDSLFSGFYYMSYTQLKYKGLIFKNDNNRNLKHREHFVNGLISGMIASILTNPLDVLKTNIQVARSGNASMLKAATEITKESGPLRFFDGLAPRTLRRSLIAATTWTFYEFFIQSWGKMIET